MAKVKGWVGFNLKILYLVFLFQFEGPSYFLSMKSKIVQFWKCSYSIFESCSGLIFKSHSFLFFTVHVHNWRYRLGETRVLHKKSELVKHIIQSFLYFNISLLHHESTVSSIDNILLIHSSHHHFPNVFYLFSFLKLQTMRCSKYFYTTWVKFSLYSFSPKISDQFLKSYNPTIL